MIPATKTFTRLPQLREPGNCRHRQARQSGAWKKRVRPQRRLLCRPLKQRDCACSGLKMWIWIGGCLPTLNAKLDNILGIFVTKGEVYRPFFIALFENDLFI